MSKHANGEFGNDAVVGCHAQAEGAGMYRPTQEMAALRLTMAFTARNRGIGRYRCVMRSGFVAMFAALLSLVVSSSGCSSVSQTKETPTSGDAVLRTAEEGPVSIKLEAGREAPTMDVPLHIELEIIAEDGVTVDEPAYDRALREGDRQFEYSVAESKREVAVPTGDGRLRWRYVYDLDFSLPGDYELPPFEVSFVDIREGVGDDAVPPESQTVSTTPIAVVVDDTHAAPLSEEELRHITRLDPVELPAVWSRWWWIAPPVAIVLAVIGVLLLRRARRRKGEYVEVEPADVWARRHLAILIADDLIAQRKVQAYYYRISDIVRGYIERRFAVSAPEMTTEEFLEAAGRDHRFASGVADELDGFLTACDMVKYARHEPGQDEANQMLKATQHFIEKTRQRFVASEDGDHAVGERAA